MSFETLTKIVSLFPERENDKEAHYCVYERKTECYKGKDGNDVKYTRTAKVDKKEKVFELVNSLLKNTPRYLKHRSYVDNVNYVLPILKKKFSGKYIELDFSENLALRPKHEVQPAHFSGKQYSLRCAIFRPSNTNFHYHLSDDTKHDAFYVDEVLRDLIQQYDIKNECVVIQFDNAPTQYKNRHAFALIQKLADEFNLRIIRTYGIAGHGKGLNLVLKISYGEIFLRKIFSLTGAKRLPIILTLKILNYVHISTDTC